MVRLNSKKKNVNLKGVRHLLCWAAAFTRMSHLAAFLLLFVSPLFSCDAATWTMHLLDDPLARCIDGSPGAFYLGPAPSPSSNTRWVGHLQGGGWCTSLDDCAARAFTHYGSSSKWTRAGECPDEANPACWGDSPSGLPDGLASLNASVSPIFAGAQHVVFPYCDGASFSGSLLAPVPYNATLTLHFRGRYILDAILRTLLDRHNLRSATEVLLKGCSAGGMAVYNQADHIGAVLRAESAPGLRFAAAPGAGMFLDRNAFQQNASFSSYLMWAARAQNVTVNEACAAAQSADPLRCFLAPVVFPYVATPLFISNSLTDSCALEFLMELGCDGRIAGNCSAAQLEYVSQYRAAMLEVVMPVVQRRRGGAGAHGAYLQACWTHIVEDDATSWAGTLVEGQHQVDTFSAWWEGGKAQLKTVVVDGEWGSNPTCSNLGGCD